MWIELLVFGGFWFWALLGVLLLELLWDIEHDNLGRSVFWIFFAMAIYWIFGPFGTAVKYIFNNPLPCLGYVVAYFAIGAFWSIIKWYLFLTGIRGDYYTEKRRWLGVESDQGENPPIPSHRKSEWRAHLDGMGSRYSPTILAQFAHGMIRPSKHKETLTMWIIYWPISMVWTLLNDPIKRLANWIYYKLAKLYRDMSKKISASAAGDLDVAQMD